MSIYTDPTKRHDFVLLFDVSQGNPNGDPDADNMPRVDPETQHGIVTDVALKRKVRDYVAVVHGRPIFIQSQVALNTLIYQAFREAGVEPTQIDLTDDELREWFEENQPEGFDLVNGKLVYAGESNRVRDIERALLAALEEESENRELRNRLRQVARQLAEAARQQGIRREDQENARTNLCNTYYDVRMFGAVLSTGLNAGQVRGPMQVTFARSIDPVLSLPLAITRQARTTTERMRTGTTEMGRKPWVPYGLYRAHGFYNPYLAEKTGVTKDDLELFWEALTGMFDLDRSAARGQMACRGLYVFTHENPKGNAPAHKLMNRVQVRSLVERPRQFEEYEVMVEGDSAGKVPRTVLVYEGVTLTVLAEG